MAVFVIDGVGLSAAVALPANHCSTVIVKTLATVMGL
jgi:hypothetical protein